MRWRHNMKKTKEIFRLIQFNWKVMAGFEIIYKLASIVLFLPLFSSAFQLIMYVRGYAYLTLENMVFFFFHPLTFMLLFLLICVMTIYSMLDIGAVIFMLDQSAQGIHVHLTQVMKFTIKNASRILKKQNILLALIVLFLIPFLHIGVTSSLISSISIPEFILEFIFQNTILTVLFLIVMLALAALLMRWLYVFHYFTLESCDFKEARKKSAALSEKRKMKSFLILLLVQFVSALLHIAFLFTGILFILLLEKLFAKILLVHVITSSLVWLLIAISFVLVSALATPLSYGTISILYYQWKSKDHESILHINAPAYTADAKWQKRIHFIQIMVGIILVSASSILVFGIYTGRINPQIEYIRTMEVTAHRGASAYYPENTTASFEGAVKLGADWIELDVQQSKDGQIFVMHDTNFLRTAGVNKNSWELTYKEISALDAGVFFHKSFAGERIPLLSEVIAFAKKKHIHLNIELKPTGHEIDFEKKVVDLILEEDFENKCVITSQLYNVLERVKEYSQDVTTVYVMSFAYGDINRLTAADHFSIEATSVTKSLVSRVHNAGKELYAWTVNTPENINRMIDLNVDNIITDDIILAKECIYNSKFSTIMDEYIKLFE